MALVITGIDDMTPMEDLIKLQEQVGPENLQYAVLVGGNGPRFPSKSTILQLQHYSKNWALHICDESLLCDRLELFPNLVQINSPGIGIKKAYDYSCFNNIKVRVQTNRYTYNDDIELLNHHHRFKNIDLLWDESRGKGTSIDVMNLPIHPRLNYAGGINSDNLERIFSIIKALREDNRELNIFSTQILKFDLDLESGARDSNNYLDMDKVKHLVGLYANCIK